MLKARKWCGWQNFLSACLLLLSTSTPTLSATYYYPAGSPVYYYHGASSSSVPMIYNAPGAAYGGYYPRSTTGRVPSASDYLSSVCVQGAYTWQLEKMPIKIWIGHGEGLPGYKPIFRDYIRRGFDTWCSASDGKLSWIEVDDPNKADVAVRWTDHVTERPEGTEAGRTSALTRLNSATGKGIVYGARMLFLTRLPERLFTDLEVEKTCLHEAGHALGLQGHSPYRDDVMYYAVSPTLDPVLTQRDRNTLVKLYADVQAPELTLGSKVAPANGTQ